MALPHQDQPVLQVGSPLDRAAAAMLCLHGRGASAEDILVGLGPPVEMPGFAFWAPQAEAGSWYPNPFTDPVARNQPWLEGALALLDGLVAEVERRLGACRLVLLGFSQGACLALECAASRPRQYGGIVGWSGA